MNAFGLMSSKYTLGAELMSGVATRMAEGGVARAIEAGGPQGLGALDKFAMGITGSAKAFEKTLEAGRAGVSHGALETRLTALHGLLDETAKLPVNGRPMGHVVKAKTAVADVLRAMQGASLAAHEPIPPALDEALWGARFHLGTASDELAIAKASGQLSTLVR